MQGYTVQVQCCFTSTETIRTIRDGEPRTATSTFTQLLSFVCRGIQLTSVVFHSIELTTVGSPLPPSPHPMQLRGRKQQQGASPGRARLDWLSLGTRSLASYCTAATIPASIHYLPHRTPPFVGPVSLIYARATCTQPSANITLQGHTVMSPPSPCPLPKPPSKDTATINPRSSNRNPTNNAPRCRSVDEKHNAQKQLILRPPVFSLLLLHPIPQPPSPPPPRPPKSYRGGGL